MSKEKSLTQLSLIASKLRKNIENISSYRDFPILIYTEKGHCFILEEISSTSVNAYSWNDYDNEDFSNIKNINFTDLDKNSIIEIYKLTKQYIKN